MNYTKAKENISQHKLSIASIAAIVPVLWGAAMFVDSRYVKAEALQQFQQKQEAISEKQEAMFKDHRKKQLEDQIFILDVKKSSGKLSPLDNALYNRYQMQLKELEK